ncbi:centromere protein S-like isoform X2 [Dysidea avara]|uniref:centromere protein S-like isoform X2 n=1 Tax=Dysidea avara TaxID=196820 RepID=UPI003327D07F
MASHETEDRLTREQRLKAALHFAVGRACEDVGRTTKVSFSREVIAAITETTFQKCESIAVDLELFAKHAKRLTVTNDDVKMVSRNNEQLYHRLAEYTIWKQILWSMSTSGHSTVYWLQ